MVAIGATSAVLTAKHGCGFLAWQPEATLPDGSPYTYHVPADKPVARLFVDAMKARGLGYGFYYRCAGVCSPVGWRAGPPHVRPVHPPPPRRHPTPLHPQPDQQLLP